MNNDNSDAPKVLWSREGARMAPGVMEFLAGDDVVLDAELFQHDIQATAAHVEGLGAVGVFSAHEVQSTLAALERLSAAFACGDFQLDARFEDGHSAIEWHLTRELGEVGRKVHTGRSRNDQVLACLRLYMLEQLRGLRSSALQAAACLLERAEAHVHTPMPGYTHLQQAMPTTLAVWLAGYAEGAMDDVDWLDAVARQLRSSPLGSAAGFGSAWPLPRAQVAQKIGLDRLQLNPLNAQNSRGKYELLCLQGVQQLMLDVRRWAWDVSLYMTAEFGFMTLAPGYSTGSSIMPNKNNPDVIELMRASVAVLDGAIQQILSLLSLPGGYQRDLQLSKGALLRGLRAARQCVDLWPGVIAALQFDTARMRALIGENMLATDRAMAAVQSGQGFRDAYHQSKSGDVQAIDLQAALAARVSPGAAGNPGLDQLKLRWQKLQ